MLRLPQCSLYVVVQVDHMFPVIVIYICRSSFGIFRVPNHYRFFQLARDSVSRNAQYPQLVNDAIALDQV